MIGVIIGDIVNSRKFDNPNKWLLKLKTAFEDFGPAPKTWEVIRGDSFQVEITQAAEALRQALYINRSLKA